MSRVRRFGQGVVVLAMLAAGGGAQGAELVYTPVNPTFGGNPFNSSHLLGVANAQNTYTAPSTTSARDPLGQLADLVQRSIISRLTAQITTQIFGKDSPDEGVVVLQDSVIQYRRVGGDIVVDFTNNATGAQTSIQFPFTPQ